MFIMVDGVDGSGKSTVSRAWRDMFEARGMKIFDTIAFEKSNGRIATIDDCDDAQVICSAEPGYAGIGKFLRDNMLKTGSKYSAREVTESFAEQRGERYEAVIIPAIKRNLLIVQDRGITSSLAYQPTMSPEITEDFVASLPGNQLAIEWRPDVVIICEVPPDIALARLARRADKSDNAVFEQRDYMARIAQRYLTDSWKVYLQKQGSQFISFDADQPIAQAIKAAQHLLLDLIY
jgi:dTMP kinase